MSEQPNPEEESDVNELFRMACGAYVKGKTKMSVRAKFDLDRIDKMIALGADVNSVDDDGWSGLHWAAAEGYHMCVRHLLTIEGININAVDNDNSTPLWITAFNGVDGAYQVTMLLLWMGADLTIRGKARGVNECGASNAARSKRNGSIADTIDLELNLRKADPERIKKLKLGQLSEDEFKDTMRKASGR